MANRTPQPPKSLSSAARAFWRRIVADWEIDDEAGLALVEVAAQAHARALDARGQIDRDGSVIRDRFGQLKAHPAVAIERDAAALVVRTVRALGLEMDAAAEPMTLRDSRRAAAIVAARGKLAPGQPPLAHRKAGKP